MRAVLNLLFGSFWGFALVVAYLLFIAGVLFRGVFVDDQTAIAAAEGFGFSQITITERHVFLPGFSGCDTGDAAGFEITALNSKGERIDNAIVCVGWPFKGATVRFK